MIMAYKVIHEGYQVAYRGEAKVVHSHSYTYRQQFHRNFDLGVSQRQYREVFQGISSEKEGAGYASYLLKYLLKHGRVAKAVSFALECGFKLMGYQLGKRYDKLPHKIVLACTMSPDYVLFQKRGANG
jgi:rhamnosyltransferase